METRKLRVATFVVLLVLRNPMSGSVPEGDSSFIFMVECFAMVGVFVVEQDSRLVDSMDHGSQNTASSWELSKSQVIMLRRYFPVQCFGLLLVMLIGEVGAMELSTSGRWIVEAHNASRKVQLSCVNWYGIDQSDMVVGGLDIQPLPNIAKLIKELGFNCVRLPISLEAVLSNPIVSSHVISANPNYSNMRALDIMDIVINTLTHENNLYVIIDEHVGRADWCCDIRDGDGLWYSKSYSEDQWIEVLKHVAIRYRNNDRVVGIELRNEIRPIVVNQRIINPTWGDQNPKTDWRLAATRAGNEVLKVNPSLLIIIGGLDFGLDLSLAQKFPVELSDPSKLVYAAHNYVWSCPTCLENKQDFIDKLDSQWGYLMHQNVAPVWLSEFGTPHTEGDGFILHAKTNNVNEINEQARWWLWLLEYLNHNFPGISFGYWPLDGTQSSGRSRVRGSEEIYGLLDMTWTKPYSSIHLAQVQSLIVKEEGYEQMKCESGLVDIGIST
jgi:endoglucanase